MIKKSAIPSISLSFFLSFRLSVFYLAILVHISLSLFKNQSKTPIELSTLKQELESDDDDHAMRESNFFWRLLGGRLRSTQGLFT